MRRHVRSLAIFASVFVLAAMSPTQSPALEKPAASCQASLGKALLKFKKTKLKAWTKCLDATLAGKTCDAMARDAAIALAASDAAAAIADKCETGVLFGAQPAGVGFPASCALKSGDLSTSEEICAALPASTNAELADCLLCWKETEIDRLLESVYPCLRGTIPDGGELQCGTAPGSCPDPTMEGDEVKCLRSLGKAATKYFLAHEKSTEKCLDSRRAGKTTDSCPDAKTASKIQKAADKLNASITKACGELPALPAFWNLCPVDATAACDDPIDSLGELSTCVESTMEELSTTLVCEQYPEATTDGVTCPQTCMAASFLDTCDGTDDDCDGDSADGSEDPLVGSSCDGTDTDMCLEGTRSCSSGALQCSDTTGSTTEVCNGADDDCDGASDENFPNNTNPMCLGGFNLGDIAGDLGSDFFQVTEMDERWYIVRVTDQFPIDYLSATVSLEAPPTVDFDLFVYCYNCGGSLAGSSENSAGVRDEVVVRRNDSGAGDDTFYMLIEVRYFSGQSCGDWLLTVVGNTAATVETCF